MQSKELKIYPMLFNTENIVLEKCKTKQSIAHPFQWDFDKTSFDITSTKIFAQLARYTEE
ncbi:hypothetical protein BpHYR1_035451 [Brachionus plicatilis]|uniref:Uncharacterized protein n=1 Tax=Brachionus plicatilis TaxID=10195 RepID=A0A3M7SR65_BRAPC|nr:hypothetical protein BpHYR1_035451 [Brachionus plicatilis]